MDLLNDLSQKPKLAPIGLRVLAALIDIIIYMAIAYGIAAAFDMTYKTENGFGFQLTGFPALLVLILWFLLVPINEGLTGQTIGKRICKIKVVRSDYSKTDLTTSLVRHILDIIDMFLLIGLIIAAANANKQRIGDMVARSYVVMK